MWEEYKAKLSSLPYMRKKREIIFERLDGGLNLRELDYRMPLNQSPDMLNLWWKDGVLSSRDGQVWVSTDTDRGRFITCFRENFRDRAFFHFGTGIYYANLALQPITFTLLTSSIPEIKGTFFRLGAFLYYKTAGVYLRIGGTGDDAEPFSCENVTEVYTPVIQKRTDPVSARGEAYESENMLTGQKTLLYDALYITDTTVTPRAYTGIKVFRLPERNITGVDMVKVGGVEKTEGTDYSCNLPEGVVTFTVSPFDSVGMDNIQDAVEITYTKADAVRAKKIMDCTIAFPYTVKGEICVIFSGGENEHGVYYWSGISSEHRDGYFPVDQYSMAGDARDPVSGFGAQQSLLMVFKNRSIGKASGSIVKINGSRHITMDYTAVNAGIGCDLGDTIQLIQNNLVFCTSAGGVYLISNSTTANENNIIHISRNIDGGNAKNGLLADIAAADGIVSSADDGTRYLITANGSSYLWDYELSDAASPSWFKFDNINAAGYLMAGKELFHCSPEGKLTKFKRCFYDYEATNPITKRYRFAVQHFGDYGVLNDAEDIVITTKSDTGSVIDLKYITEDEEREDRTPLTAVSWKLYPRELTYRYLGITRFAAVFKRQPKMKHIRHFTMELCNSEPMQDMSIISAKIVFRKRGIEK